MRVNLDISAMKKLLGEVFGAAPRSSVSKKMASEDNIDFSIVSND